GERGECLGTVAAEALTGARRDENRPGRLGTFLFESASGNRIHRETVPREARGSEAPLGEAGKCQAVRSGPSGGGGRGGLRLSLGALALGGVRENLLEPRVRVVLGEVLRVHELRGEDLLRLYVHLLLARRKALL